MPESTGATESFATELDLPAPIEEVFRHLTDPAAMIRWMGQHVTLDPAVGGAFEVDINGVPVRGRYLEVDPPRRVVVSWGVAGSTDLPPGATEVEFTLPPSRPAPTCGWSTGACHPARHPSTPPAGTTSCPASPLPPPEPTPALTPGTRPTPVDRSDRSRSSPGIARRRAAGSRLRSLGC